MQLPDPVKTVSLYGHKDWVVSVCALPATASPPGGNRVVSGSQDGTLKVWDADNRRGRSSLSCLATLEGHTAAVCCVCAIRASGHGGGARVVSGSFDKTLRVWEIDTKLKIAAKVDSASTATEAVPVASSEELAYRCVAVLEGHSDTVYAVCALPGGRRVVSGSGDGTLKVWDVDPDFDTGSRFSCLLTLTGHASLVKSVCVLRDGLRVVSGSHNGEIRVWSVEDGRCVGVLLFEDPVTVVCALPDGNRVAAGILRSHLLVIDVDRKRIVAKCKGPVDNIYGLCALADGRRVVSGSWERNVAVWNVDNGHCLATFERHTAAVFSLCPLSDGRRVVSASRDCTLNLWSHGVFQVSQRRYCWLVRSVELCCTP